MNDEIKEILDKLQKVANRETASRNTLMEMKDKDYQLLLDYITNLQEENKMYAQLKKEYEDIIDKAAEYIKKEIADIEFMKKEYKDIDKIYDTIVEIDVRCINKLNDILNGDNE